jgi:pimeloyl-ACP methyl ester carboxylesterase
VVFIHGVLNDHSVWILQSRYFAHHGWNVLAIDLPGQGKSGGQPPASVEEAADTVVGALLDAAGVQKAALVGHSFGSLIALEAAARAPDAGEPPGVGGHGLPDAGVARAAGVLGQGAREGDPHGQRVQHSTLCPPPSALGPGTWLYGGSPVR